MNKLNGIGLGTFPFGGVFAEIDDEVSSGIIKEFIELGGRLINVSVVYNDGKVEELLGKVFKMIKREDFEIMSCCGWKEIDGDFELSGKREDVLTACTNSLRRLDLEYIDVFMSHGPDLNTPFRETIDAMKELKEAGKIGKICVSNVSLSQLKEYNYDGSVDYIQNRFSLLNRNMNDEFFGYCKENNIGITTYQSIERGLLTDRVYRGLELRNGDLRNKKSEFRDIARIEIGKWVKSDLLEIARRLGVSVVSLVISWTLRNQNVETCFCGITNKKYFKDYLDASNLVLSEADIEEINMSYSKFEKFVKDKYALSVIDFMGISNT